MVGVRLASLCPTAKVFGVFRNRVLSCGYGGMPRTMSVDIILETSMDVLTSSLEKGLPSALTLLQVSCFAQIKWIWSGMSSDSNLRRDIFYVFFLSFTELAKNSKVSPSICH